MTVTSAERGDGQVARPRVAQMLNHAAYVTHDIEATVRFYDEVLGMELANTVVDDRIPSTGDPFPYFHAFFRLGDGSTIAFFESPGLPPAQHKGHPAYEIFDHIAFDVETPEVVLEWKEWLEANDIDVIGPVDHEGLIYSIYFHDPNGHRLELTAPLRSDWNHQRDEAEADLAAWLAAKRRAEEQGTDLAASIGEMVTNRRNG